MSKKLLAALAATTALVAFTPAQAAVLVSGSGWQDDVLSGIGSPTDSSPWTFTVTTDAVLSIVDCCNVGDIYTITGDVSGVTSFFAGSPTDVQASGNYGGFWLDPAFSKIAIGVAAGTYTFSITGDGAGGVPAGLGVRLDAAVPEPATWAMLVMGFGAVGCTMRRKTRTSVHYDFA